MNNAQSKLWRCPRFAVVFPLGKKAQVSTGVSWFTATIIIVFILAISIYLSSFAPPFDRSISYDLSSELFMTKSISGYLLSDCDNLRIFESISENLDFNDCEGEKAKKIFLPLVEHPFCMAFGKSKFSPKNNFLDNCRVNWEGKYSEDNFWLDADSYVWIYGGSKDE